MGTWKKIITSGSSADLLNITSSGGIQIGSLSGGGASDLVLVRNSAGDIVTRTQTDIGALGSNAFAFKTIDAPSGTDPVAASSNDTLNFAASHNITINGNSTDKSLTFSATTKSAADITTILSQSLTSGTHKNITINEPSAGVFSLTGSQNLLVSDTTGQRGVDLIYNSANNSLTASLVGLTTQSSVRFADITSTGNISASGFISASALDVTNDAEIGGNLTLDGNFLFDGFNFESSDILNHSGSNIFGSGSQEPSTIVHQFTGSISVTGSGITLVDGIFTGDGSGLTNIAASSLPAGLLSSSNQIASDISGAYTGDTVTILKDGGEFSAITDAVAVTNTGLALGSTIFTYVNSATQSLSQSVAANYISSIANATEGGIDVSNGSAGDVTLGINISNLADSSTDIATGDFIAFDDSGTTKKATIAALGALITASSAGTVTSVAAGDGLTGTTFSTIGTIAVGAGANISVTSDGVALASSIGGSGGNAIVQVTAKTGSFAHLVVDGSTTILNTETVSTDDNFIELNSNQPDSAPSQDAGISVNRGSSQDANLFWAEDVTGEDFNIGRWALSIQNLSSTATDGNDTAYLTSVSQSALPPSNAPIFGNTAGTGNMHIDTATGDIWMYV